MLVQMANSFAGNKEHWQQALNHQDSEIGKKLSIEVTWDTYKFDKDLVR